MRRVMLGESKVELYPRHVKLKAHGPDLGNDVFRSGPQGCPGDGEGPPQPVLALPLDAYTGGGKCIVWQCLAAAAAHWPLSSLASSDGQVDVSLGPSINHVQPCPTHNTLAHSRSCS